MDLQLQSMLQQAIQAFHSGNFDSADLVLKQILQIDSKNLPALHILGLIKVSQLNYKEAANYLSKAAQIHPNDVSIQYNLAKALVDSGNIKGAISHYKKVVSLDPNILEGWYEYGMALFNLGRYEEALVAFNRVVMINPNLIPAWGHQGISLHELKRYEEAIVSYQKVLSLDPCDIKAWRNIGLSLFKLKRFEEAIAYYDRALSLNPNYAEGWSNKGAALNELKRFDEAITHYDRAISLQPDFAEAWTNKGATLNELKRFDEAIAHYDRAISFQPDFAEAWANKGAILYVLKKYDAAVSHYDKALSLNPYNHEAWSGKGHILDALKMHSDSAKCFLKAAMAIKADSYLRGQAHHQMMLACDWYEYEKNINEIFRLTNEGRKGADPFGFLGIANSENLLKKCAEIYSNDIFPQLGNLSEFSQYKHNKIRIGYLCGEFRNQATSILMTRVWELHDKEKFEIFAFDNGFDDGTDYRKRIVGAFNNIFDISNISDIDAAKLIQENEIDILVNLNGFFGLPRQRVFAYKPAPIQVNYLGFPGTIGAQYIDYIIADKVVIPEESKMHYVEKVVYLPHSFQANDNQRKIADRKFLKTEMGLPENVFVFACFNNNYKITPTTFDSWMKILSLVPKSVLWLLADNAMAKENLVKEAVARGMDASRLIFAERLDIHEHLARHNLADLFLDTLPCNAHTTCSDALWAELPVLTLQGSTFPGRVSASLLSAIGLSELIAHTSKEYELLAVEIALNPQKLADIKLKLKNNRLTTPLFDTSLFTRNLETAYTMMAERYSTGLRPDHLSVV